MTWQDLNQVLTSNYLNILIYVIHNVITLFVGNSNHQITTEWPIEKGKQQTNSFSSFKIGKLYSFI